MLVADGTNVTASVGPDGIAVVNTGSVQMSDKIIATLNQLAETTVARTQPNTCFGAFCPGAWGWSSPYFNTFIASPAPPKSIRYVINTSAAADQKEMMKTAALRQCKQQDDGLKTQLTAAGC